MLPYNKKTC